MYRKICPDCYNSLSLKEAQFGQVYYHCNKCGYDEIANEDDFLISDIPSNFLDLYDIDYYCEINKEQKEAEKAEKEYLSDMEEKLNLVFKEEMSLDEFNEECKRDNISFGCIDKDFLVGLDAKGRVFTLSINNGGHAKSEHCYTARVDGEVIIISGRFSACYKRLMEK